MNFIKSATLLDKKLLYYFKLCFNKGFLITFCQLYFKQPSATRSNYYVMLIHKLRAVDQQGYYTCCCS